MKLPIPFPRKGRFYKSISYQGPSRWLALPNSLKRIDAVEEFNKAIKEWYPSEFIKGAVVYLNKFDD